jgi:hypothetical protein
MILFIKKLLRTIPNQVEDENLGIDCTSRK